MDATMETKSPRRSGRKRKAREVFSMAEKDLEYNGKIVKAASYSKRVPMTTKEIDDTIIEYAEEEDRDDLKTELFGSEKDPDADVVEDDQSIEESGDTYKPTDESSASEGDADGEGDESCGVSEVDEPLEESEAEEEEYKEEDEEFGSDEEACPVVDESDDENPDAKAFYKHARYIKDESDDDGSD